MVSAVVGRRKSSKSSSKAKKKADLLQRLQACREQPENKVCADCGEDDPNWASLLKAPAAVKVSNKKLGIFCCNKCCSYHFQMGREICEVKNIKTADDWSEEEVKTMEASGNAIAHAIYEGLVDNGFVAPDPADHEAQALFVEDKYKHIKFFCRDTYQTHCSWFTSLEQRNSVKKKIQTKIRRGKHKHGKDKHSKESVSSQRQAFQEIVCKGGGDHGILSRNNSTTDLIHGPDSMEDSSSHHFSSSLSDMKGQTLFHHGGRPSLELKLEQETKRQWANSTPSGSPLLYVNCAADDDNHDGPLAGSGYYSSDFDSDYTDDDEDEDDDEEQEEEQVDLGYGDDGGIANALARRSLNGGGRIRRGSVGCGDSVCSRGSCHSKTGTGLPRQESVRSMRRGSMGRQRQQQQQQRGPGCLQRTESRRRQSVSQRKETVRRGSINHKSEEQHGQDHREERRRSASLRRGSHAGSNRDMSSLLDSPSSHKREVDTSHHGRQRQQQQQQRSPRRGSTSVRKCDSEELPRHSSRGSPRHGSKGHNGDEIPRHSSRGSTVTCSSSMCNDNELPRHSSRGSKTRRSNECKDEELPRHSRRGSTTTRSSNKCNDDDLPRHSSRGSTPRSSNKCNDDELPRHSSRGSSRLHRKSDSDAIPRHSSRGPSRRSTGSRSRNNQRQCSVRSISSDASAGEVSIDG